MNYLEWARTFSPIRVKTPLEKKLREDWDVILKRQAEISRRFNEERNARNNPPPKTTWQKITDYFNAGW